VGLSAKTQVNIIFVHFSHDVFIIIIIYIVHRETYVQ